MKKFINIKLFYFLFSLILILVGLSNIHPMVYAQDTEKCQIRPDMDRYCKRFDSAYSFYSGVTSDAVGVCYDSKYDVIACDDDYWRCTYPKEGYYGWKAYCEKDQVICCPASYKKHTTSDGNPFCCPPEFKKKDSDSTECVNNEGNFWDGESLIKYFHDLPVEDQLNWVRQYHSIESTSSVFFIININKQNSLMEKVGERDEKLYGCFNTSAPCMKDNEDMSYNPNTTPDKDGYVQESNLKTKDEAKDCVCRSACTLWDFDSNKKYTDDNDKVCIAEKGWQTYNAKYFSGDKPTGTDSTYGICSGIVDTRTGERLQSFFQGCNVIKYNKNGSLKPGFIRGSEMYEEYYACLACEGLPESPTGNVWTEVGCVEPTGSGVVTRIMQIGTGIMGMIIIVRIIQIVVLLNKPDPSGDNMKEAREIVISIVVFAFFLSGAVIILRFLGYNILGIDLPIFTGQ